MGHYFTCPFPCSLSINGSGDELTSQGMVRTKWPNVSTSANQGHNLTYSERRCQIRGNWFLPHASWPFLALAFTDLWGRTVTATHSLEPPAEGLPSQMESDSSRPPLAEGIVILPKVKAREGTAGHLWNVGRLGEFFPKAFLFKDPIFFLKLFLKKQLKWHTFLVCFQNS